MKETKDSKEKKILEIASKGEAIALKKIATGRRFFKVGERVIDICEQEVQRYHYEHAGFLTRLFHQSRWKKKKAQYMIESRIPSCIRAIAAYCLREEEENDELILNARHLQEEVREYILSVVNEYEMKDEGKNKVIEIKAKVKKEA